MNQPKIEPVDPSDPAYISFNEYVWNGCLDRFLNTALKFELVKETADAHDDFVKHMRTSTEYVSIPFLTETLAMFPNSKPVEMPNNERDYVIWAHNYFMEQMREKCPANTNPTPIVGWSPGSAFKAVVPKKSDLYLEKEIRKNVENLRLLKDVFELQVRTGPKRFEPPDTVEFFNDAWQWYSRARTSAFFYANEPFLLGAGASPVYTTEVESDDRALRKIAFKLTGHWEHTSTVLTVAAARKLRALCMNCPVNKIFHVCHPPPGCIVSYEFKRFNENTRMWLVLLHHKMALDRVIYYHFILKRPTLYPKYRKSEDQYFFVCNVIKNELQNLDAP